jgi:hypothetical protein
LRRQGCRVRLLLLSRIAEFRNLAPDIGQSSFRFLGPLPQLRPFGRLLWRRAAYIPLLPFRPFIAFIGFAIIGGFIESFIGIDFGFFGFAIGLLAVAG